MIENFQWDFFDKMSLTCPVSVTSLSDMTTHVPKSRNRFISDFLKIKIFEKFFVWACLQSNINSKLVILVKIGHSGPKLIIWTKKHQFGPKMSSFHQNHQFWVNFRFQTTLKYFFRILFFRAQCLGLATHKNLLYCEKNRFLFD